MDSRAQTVEIDHDKLCRYIRDTLHMTLIDFSYSIGKSKGYISGLARNPRVPGAAYSLICEKCREMCIRDSIIKGARRISQDEQ